MHGANRLASNSLTEAIVSGERLGRILGGTDRDVPRGELYEMGAVGVGVSPGGRESLAEATSAGAGVLRSADGLNQLLGTLSETPEAEGELTLSVLEATNLHTTSTLIAYAALLREESRGCHQRSDFPATEPLRQHPLVLKVESTEIRAVA